MKTWKLVLCLLAILTSSNASIVELFKIDIPLDSTLFPIENFELQAGNSLGTIGMVYRSQDSIYMNTGSIGCLLCVGCSCVMQNIKTLAKLPIDPSQKGIPLQKSARVWGPHLSTYPQPLYFIVAKASRLILYTFRIKSSYLDSTAPLVRIDTITVNSTPALGNRTIMGIDTFYQADTLSPFNVRLFGSGGWIGNVQYIPGDKSTTPVSAYPLLPDSLNICSSGQGFYGTTNGYILESSNGNYQPIKVANRPIIAITPSGAVGDSGLFVLHEFGQWRNFKLGSENFRYTSVYYGGVSKGSSGTFGKFWDNRFISYPYFIKDDSTVWANTYNGAIFDFSSKDSTKISLTVPDSADLALFDPDYNYSHPTISLHPKVGSSKTLSNLWGPFATGCNAQYGDTITCFTDPYPLIHLTWDSLSVRVRTSLKRGHWYWLMAGDTFDNTPFNIDTSISWLLGDTLRVKFSNASFRLVHNAHTTAMEEKPKSNESNVKFQIFPDEIRWSFSKQTSVQWQIRDVRGHIYVSGSGNQDGKISVLQIPRGFYAILFRETGSSQNQWQQKVMIIL